MPSDRGWSDTDRELVERAWRSTSGVRLDGIEMMISDAMRAADVLDALTAAGWRRESDVRAEMGQEIAQVVRLGLQLARARGEEPTDE